MPCGLRTDSQERKCRLEEAQVFIRELLEFAAQMEFEVIPVNWMVSGIIPNHNRLLREILGEEAEEAQPLVSRPIFKRTIEGGNEMLWYEIDHEHVQGVVLCRHYGEWILTWNVTRGGLLGGYCQVAERETRTLFDPQEATSPRSLLSTIGDFVNSAPVEVRGEFGETHINIHCPWRRSDAAAACDVVELLLRHADGLEARDDMGVWPDKDFTKWVNFAHKYAGVLGTAPLHPDPADALESGEQD
jgi:hypothetical protein